MSRPGVEDDPSSLSVRKRLLFLAKDSVIYGGAAAFNKAFALITFPILARHFSVTDYGIIDFVMVLAALLTILFVFGQDSAVARFFYEYDDLESRKQVISESLLLQVALLLSLLPIAWIVAGEVAAGVIDSPDAILLVRLVLLQAPFLLLINFSQNILKWTFRRARFLFVSVGSTVVSVGALIIGILTTDLTVPQVVMIYLGAQAVFGIVGLGFVRHWLSWPRDWSFLKELIPYAIPYGIIGVVGALIPTLERTFVSQYAGPRELGLFAAGSKVAMAIGLPVRAFHVAWGPFSLAIYKQPDAAVTYNWVLKAFAVGIFALVLGVTMAGPPIIRLLAGDRYDGAGVVVFGLSLALALQATGWITSIGISLSKRSALNLIAYAVFLVVSVAAIIGLLRVFGLPGAAWGALLGYLVKTIVESWLAQRAYPLPWEYRPVMACGLLTIGLGLLSQLAYPVAGTAAASIIAGSGALLVLAYGWWVVFDVDDRGKILRTVRSFTQKGRAL